LDVDLDGVEWHRDLRVSALSHRDSVEKATLRYEDGSAFIRVLASACFCCQYQQDNEKKKIKTCFELNNFDMQKIEEKQTR
jgi:hypothetical protein